MSIEQALADLTAAVQANTEALKAVSAGGATTAKTEATPTKSAKADKAQAGNKGDSSATAGESSKGGKFTKEQMTAALNDVKEKLGVASAKELIKTVGKAEKMADITDPERIDATYEAAKAKLTEAEEAM